MGKTGCDAHSSQMNDSAFPYRQTQNETRRLSCAAFFRTKAH
jgi:hypothetical protein